MAKKSLATSKNGARKTTTTTVKRAPARKPAAKAPIKAQPVKAAPTREEIARRAFEIYMGRGQVPGREREDWAQAERELVAEAHRNN